MPKSKPKKHGKSVKKPAKKSGDSVAVSSDQAEGIVSENVEAPQVDVPDLPEDTNERIEVVDDENGLVKIELDHVVELNGKYYRGVQVVAKEMAEKLLALDQQMGKVK
jgi:hypothetical protein